MKIRTVIDLDMMEDDCGNSFGQLVKDIITADIKYQLKRSPEYKEFIKRETDKAIKGLGTK